MNWRRELRFALSDAYLWMFASLALIVWFCRQLGALP